MAIVYTTADTGSIKTRLEELKTKTTFTNSERGEVLDAVTGLQVRVANNPATDLQESSESLLLIQQMMLNL